MKRLLIIRHAKAVEHDQEGDFYRELASRGLKDAEHLANHLSKKNRIPDHVITSPAVRTTMTAEIITRELSLPKAEPVDAIYEASEPTLLNVVNSLDNRYDYVALVGHNPGVSYLIYYLTGEILDVPTSAATLIKFEIDDWKEVSGGTGTIKWHYTP